MGCIRGITENSPGGQAMKILLTGAAGQLGQALRQQVPAGVELIATCRSGGNGLLAMDLAEGAASWYDVALAVGEPAQELGLLERSALVSPLTTAEYPLPAQRPSYSLLDCASCWSPWHEPSL